MPSRLLLPLALLPLGAVVCGLTACSNAPSPIPTAVTVPGSQIRGSLHGGQQPVSGSRVYLMAASTSGYANAAVSLLSPSAAGVSTDSTGSYVTSDITGSFTITGDYTCTSGQQVYLLALGGNPGLAAGTSNNALALMTVLGACPTSGSFLSGSPVVHINEVTTVAAVFSLAALMSDGTHVGAPDGAVALQGMANAFATAGNIVSSATGMALTTTPALNGTVPQTKINTLANIISACVDSDGAGSGCTSLFSATANGTSPGDTIAALVNLAHSPSTNISALYAIAPPSPPYQPTLSSAPGDFTLSVSYPNPVGGGLAIDAAGNIYAASYASSGSSVNEFSPVGAPLEAYAYSPPSGSAAVSPEKTSIAPNGDVYVTSRSSYFLRIRNGTAAVQAPAGYYTTYAGVFDPSSNFWDVDLHGSLNSFNTTPARVVGPASAGSALSYEASFDNLGNLWVLLSDSTVVRYARSTTNTTLFTAASLGLASGPHYSLAVDGSNRVWISSNSGGSLVVFDSSGTAVAGSPFSTGLSLANYIAIDGDGSVWVTGTQGTLAKVSASGASLSPAGGFLPSGSLVSPGFAGGYHEDLAIDASGNIWVSASNAGVLYQYIGLAAPTNPNKASTAGTYNVTGRPAAAPISPCVVSGSSAVARIGGVAVRC